jgi:hypothetical protein
MTQARPRISHRITISLAGTLDAAAGVVAAGAISRTLSLSLTHTHLSNQRFIYTHLLTPPP